MMQLRQACSVTFVSAVLLCGAQTAAAAPTLGERPPTVELKGDDGGRIDGSAWSSDSLKDRVFAFFYVDPDHRDKNEHVKEALNKEQFPKDKFTSVAVINMDASWLPNGVISSSVKSNQEKYPDVVYVKDQKKALVKQWKLADDAYVILVLDKQGRILFNREGDLNADDVAAMIKLIREHLND